MNRHDAIVPIRGREGFNDAMMRSHAECLLRAERAKWSSQQNLDEDFEVQLKKFQPSYAVV
jgi:hypothetical protein